MGCIDVSDGRVIIGSPAQNADPVFSRLSFSPDICARTHESVTSKGVDSLNSPLPVPLGPAHAPLYRRAEAGQHRGHQSLCRGRNERGDCECPSLLSGPWRPADVPAVTVVRLPVQALRHDLATPRTLVQARRPRVRRGLRYPRGEAVKPRATVKARDREQYNLGSFG